MQRCRCYLGTTPFQHTILEKEALVWCAVLAGTETIDLGEDLIPK